MITLRKKAPYTCRFEIAGKPCAAYLKDCDGDLCAAHTQAVERFSAAPVACIVRAGAKEEEAEQRRARWPFWP